ncbi:MAG: hypothetical protein N2A42_07955 [Luteolibacter sp.]
MESPATFLAAGRRFHGLPRDGDSYSSEETGLCGLEGTDAVHPP